MSNKNKKLRNSTIFVLVTIICILAAVVVVVSLNIKNNFHSTTQSGQANSATKVTSSELSSSNIIVSSVAASLKSEMALGGLLMLVNKDHALPENYTPNLVNVPIKYYLSTDKDNHFDSRAAPYLVKFIDDGRAAGFSLDIVSGYRTYDYQQSNYDRHVKIFLSSGESSSKAKADAANLVAPPGTSEHETGLAADIITSDWYNKNTDLTASFDQTPAFAWMYAHCADYGFILRYLKTKVSVTGYDYEPWHYRFVGVDNAKKIMASGLCLEEYLKTIQ